MVDHKALALEESAEWRSLSAEERKRNSSQRNYWKQKGRASREVEGRQSLLNSQGADSFLWSEVEKGLPLMTAVKLARKSKLSGTSLRELWKEYQSSGSVVHHNGKTYRRVATTRHGKRSFNATLTLVEQALEQEPLLAALDPFMRGQYVHEVLTAFRMLLSDLRQRVRRDPSVHISRKQMMEDCRSFNLDTPDIGQPVDLDAARRARGQKAAQLHPDKNGGDISQLPLYREIMEAFQRLQQYNDQLNPKKDD